MDPSTIFDNNLDNLPNDQPDEKRATIEAVEVKPVTRFAVGSKRGSGDPGGATLESVDLSPAGDEIPVLIPAVASTFGTRSTQAVQRGIDILVSIIGLVFFLPLFLLISLAIKLDSPGPVLFTQDRVGHRGAPFKLYKFRSMVRDAEQRRAELWVDNERNGPVFKIKNDPRVTRLGHYLRKYSLDELPQLFNILRGEMSLVGPRPALPFEVEMYSPWQRQRLAVVPGLTGLWQVSGRANVSFEQSVDLDLEYIRTQSIRLNLRIILLTIPKVLSGEGAY